jgi:hypothetical protein
VTIHHRRQLLIRDRRMALTLGLAAYALGSLLLWDAYENRGGSRPFLMRFVSAAA